MLVALTVVGCIVGVEAWRRRREVRAVERALYFETVHLRTEAMAMAVEIARRRLAREPLDTGFFLRWRLSTPLIYPALGARLGLLDRDALDRIGYFHAQLANARERLAEARAAGAFEPSPYRMLSALLRPACHVLAWIQGLEPRERLVEVSMVWPDTTQAMALLADFEERAEEPVVQAYSWTD